MRRSRASFALALASFAGLASGCSNDPPASPEPQRAYDLRALMLTSADESTPALSPDGTRVAFVRGGAIVVLDIASRVQTEVAPRGESPSWSPDGNALYYQRRDTGPLIHRLVRRALPSGPEIVLSPDTVDVYDPVVSPDGARVAYRALSRITLLQSLRVMDADGSSEIVVSAPGEWTDGAPAWSPDGSRLAFVRLAKDGTSQIWRVDAEGAAVPALVPITTELAADPAWSPDGVRFAFSQQGALVTSPVGGGAASAFVTAPGFAMAPDFARDGRSLVFVSNRFGNFDVFLLVANGPLGAGPYSP